MHSVCAENVSPGDKTEVLFDPMLPSSMCDRVVTFLYVGLWSGCYIPHCFVRLPLSGSGF